MSKNMEAIVSPQDMQPWVRQLISNQEWMDGFDEETGRLNKIIIMTARRPTDRKWIDVVGIIEKEILRPFGLHESFIDKPMPPHPLTADQMLIMLHRVAVIPHIQELKQPGRDPNHKEVDYVDFRAMAMGVAGAVQKTMIHQRHTQKFGQQLVNFLGSGVRPIVLLS